MSDIEREEFEQAVADKWSDSYKFTRFGDEDYYDEIVEGMWRGWQASREEGEPIGFLQSSGVSQLSGGHPAKLYPIGATPSPFESSTLVYTHPASSDDWIKCSERLPNLGQRVILKSRGVVQNYMPVFDQGGDDRGMGDHFWDFEDINDIDNPLVDFEKDCWMPRPEQLNQELGQ